jgi:hypothetical protein
MSAEDRKSLFALEHIRRMRGGSQCHLMRCSDNGYYVVKFQGNPQGTRILVNDFLGTRLAVLLGLPAAKPAVCYVSEELIRITPDLCIEAPIGRLPCRPGLQFGSRYPVDPQRVTVFDLLSENRLLNVANLRDFLGMLVFDVWTGNADGRQAVFFRPRTDAGYQAVMVDQGGCFNSIDWSFPDDPRRGLYCPRLVYRQVKGLADFEPWTARLETGITESVLCRAAEGIPPEWYGGDSDSLQRLLEQLYLRRIAVPELLVRRWESSRDSFPNWNRRVLVPKDSPAILNYGA